MPSLLPKRGLPVSASASSEGAARMRCKVPRPAPAALQCTRGCGGPLPAGVGSWHGPLQHSMPAPQSSQACYGHLLWALRVVGVDLVTEVILVERTIFGPCRPKADRVLLPGVVAARPLPVVLV
mmetsp:Transcript_83840/g.260398  ORF Transcript_83840/g.260398 Transcript_83840/m.260398 type:complete len:124 (+) Transcript_83840:31-402(+)